MALLRHASRERHVGVHAWPAMHVRGQRELRRHSAGQVVTHSETPAAYWHG